MKTILILLFFASVGYSQNHADSIYFTHAKNRAYLNNHFTFWLLSYYDLYEKELQNDSIYINTYYYWDRIGFKQQTDTIIIDNDPTFKGFMQWLKKQ